MPLQPVTVKRIYLHIAEQLARAIREGEYAPGSTLPGERTLAMQFKVSRASVREALIALQLMGLVDVRHGNGAVVTATTPMGLSADQLGQEISAFEVMRARQIIEPEVARLAAEAASDDDVRQLEETVALMEREIRAESPDEEGDRRFHACLAAMSRNAVLEMFVRQMWELRRYHLFDVLHQRAFTHAHRQVYLADHRRILACIAQRDGPGARQEMLRHLHGVERYFLRP